MTKSLKWRLGKLPTPEEVTILLKEKVITKDEAREILFNLTDEKEVEELKSEIKFLREIVEQLSRNRTTQLIEIIRETIKPSWGQYPFYQPYYTWTNAGGGGGAGFGNSSYGMSSSGGTITSASSTNALYTVGDASGSGQVMLASGSSEGDALNGLANAVDNGPSFSDIKTF